MTDDGYAYEAWITDALKGVLRRALLHVAQQGLIGEHHFYINFRTTDEGVKIPDFLRAQYPEEITVVLQYQFEDLNIDEHGFAVTLSFSGNQHRLYVPFEAVTSFSDPSVNFGIQMQPQFLFNDLAEDEADPEQDTQREIVDRDQAFPEEPSASNADKDDKGTADVIALDAFRNKK